MRILSNIVANGEGKELIVKSEKSINAILHSQISKFVKAKFGDKYKKAYGYPGNKKILFILDNSADVDVDALNDALYKTYKSFKSKGVVFAPYKTETK